MNINTQVWGDPIAYFAMFNQRTGASDLTDPDFEDYPAFTYSKLAGDAALDHEYDRVTLRSGVDYKGTYWIPDRNYPDISIAYCGIKNPNLPQTNVICVGMGSESPAADYTRPLICFRSDPDKVKPVMFISNIRYSELLTNTTYPKVYNSTLNSPYYYVSGSPYYGEYFWSPNYTDSSSISERNCSFDMAYWRSFGIRSLIGIIMVRYYDPSTELNNTSKMPNTSHIASLQWFDSQGDSWKASQKIITAWLDLKVRRSVNGSYETLPTNIRESFMWDCYYGIECDSVNMAVIAGKEKIYCPSGAVTTQSTNYTLPLFGPQHGFANYYTSYSTNSGGGASTTFATLVGNEFGVLKHGEGNSTNLRRVWLERDGDLDTDFFRHAAAAYGLFFTDGLPTEAGYADLFAEGHDEDRWTDPNMCLGVVDPKGFTDGTYTRGTNNSSANNFGWKDSTQSAYDPSHPPIPDNEYSTQTTFNSIGDLSTMTRRYVMTGAAVELLGSALWDISSALSGSGTDYSDYSEKTIDQFLTNNPIDAIISLQRYPMEIPKVTATTVKLGKTDTGISAYEMEKTAYFYLFSGRQISPIFNDSFLDYQPYTKMELYVPFCGTIQMNPADIIGRTLNVQLVVDFTTGTATGFVMSDDLVIETVNGNIAIDIPVTGTQAVTVASQLNNAIANKSNKTLETQSASLGNISAGGVIRAIKDPIKMIYAYQQTKNEEQRAEYEMTHQNAPVHIIGSASAVGAWAIDLQCRLIIYYPTGDVIQDGQPPSWNDQQLAKYGRTTGFACCIESSIGDMGVGLVVGVNPDLNGMVTNSTAANPATAAELDMIRAAIGEGVIVPQAQ